MSHRSFRTIICVLNLFQLKSIIKYIIIKSLKNNIFTILYFIYQNVNGTKLITVLKIKIKTIRVIGT